MRIWQPSRYIQLKTFLIWNHVVTNLNGWGPTNLDDLFQKNLPDFFLRIMKLSLIGDNPKGKSSFVCSLMKLIAQFRAEKIDRFRRKSVSNEEDKLKAGLGFAGDS